MITISENVREKTMLVNIKEFLGKCGVSEPLYPGKRMVQKLPQSGEHKSHCVVYDWRAPQTLRVEIKAGLHGKDLIRKDLAKYPVSFQSATFVEFDTSKKQSESDEGEEGSASGGRGGSGDSRGFSKSAFSNVVAGKIPELGDIKKFVLMGKEIAKDVYKTLLDSLAAQIHDLVIAPVNLLATAHAVNVTVVTPGGGLAPKGTETARYNYKGREMFGLE